MDGEAHPPPSWSHLLPDMIGNVRRTVSRLNYIPTKPSTGLLSTMDISLYNSPHHPPSWSQSRAEDWPHRLTPLPPRPLNDHPSASPPLVLLHFLREEEGRPCFEVKINEHSKSILRCKIERVWMEARGVVVRLVITIWDDTVSQISR